MDIYFNLKVEKHVYTNGSRKNQLEIVDFLDTDEPKGIGFGNLYTKSLKENTTNSQECKIPISNIMLCKYEKTSINNYYFIYSFQIPHVSPSVRRKSCGLYLRLA